jgi:hypothetical protein
MKKIFLIGFLFINSCIGIDNAMNKQQQAEFLVRIHLYNTLEDSSNYRSLRFSKLDTDKNYIISKYKNATIMQNYQANLDGKYWIMCTYKVKNQLHEALFGFDTMLTKIDTVIEKNKVLK